MPGRLLGVSLRPAMSRVAQSVSPATPSSLPTQRQPGPPLEKMTHCGLASKTTWFTDAQSKFPAWLPSNHISTTGAYFVIRSLRAFLYIFSYSAVLFPDTSIIRSQGER